MKKYIFILAVALFFYSLPLAAEKSENKNLSSENKECLSFSIDYLSSSVLVFGANAEYSPNYKWDFGLGFTPSLFPCLEIHIYTRYNPINYFISPYFQLSASFLYPNQIRGNSYWGMCKLIAGAKFKIGKYFFCGLGAGYQLIGYDEASVTTFHGFFPTSFHGFFPTAFIGATAISWHK